MGNVFHRVPNRKMPIAIRGEGMHIIDSDGKRYIDGYAGGACVSCLGHSHPAVIEAVQNQISRFAFCHGAVFTSEPLEELGDILTTSAPDGLSKVFFVNSGSEAVESSVMLARQYFVELGQTDRRHVISRHNSYHGATLTTIGIGHQVARRAPFEPLLPNVTHISPCYEYRGRQTDESVEEYGLRVANELELAIINLGPETVMAFVAETVTGTTAGAVPPVPGYFKRIREICDQYGVLLILDEVFCGLGRTGTLHACEQDGVAPDFLCMAKGIAAGYQPIGATLVHQKIFDAIVSGTGVFRGGFTYSGHATACAAAVAVQKVLRADGFLQNVRDLGEVLGSRLKERFGNHPNIGDIRGRGMLMTMELVNDRSTKAAFPTDWAVSSRIYNNAMSSGLITHALSGTIDGVLGDHVVVCPPLIATPADLVTIVDLLAQAIETSLTEAKKVAA